MKRIVMLLILCSLKVSATSFTPQQEALLWRLSSIQPDAFNRMIDDWEATWEPTQRTKEARQFVATVQSRKQEAIVALKEKRDTQKAEALLQEVKQRVLQLPLLKDLEIVAYQRDFGDKARREQAPGQASMACYNISEGRRNTPSTLVKLTNIADEKPRIEKIYFSGTKTMANMDLHFNAQKVLYVAVGPNGRFNLWEVGIDGKEPQTLLPDDINYDVGDACYLPDGKIIFTSTAGEQGLPCESGRLAMTNCYRLDRTTGKIDRQTYDQDSNWSPTMMNDGRVMYVRWEYCDQSHFFSRIVMTMRPDGTDQRAYYGSNGFWPNHYGDPIPIPGANGQFVSIVTGHHTQKSGKIALFDVSKGRKETSGCVQLIPGWNKPVENKVADYLYAGEYPKSLMPYPLGSSPTIDGAGRYFLVSMKPTPRSLWGIYLVDIFDNVTLLCEEEEMAFNEPIRFAKRQTPHVYPDFRDDSKTTCSIHIADIYHGPGLRHVPRGTVKSVRVFAYHYAFLKAGSHEGVGTESSWDMKYVLGTVPVQDDGSVYFTAPANTPLSLQPLDKEGASTQLMRSWLVGMPGENVSCTGCHENANSITPGATLTQAPVSITPWRKQLTSPGGIRTWSFLRDVQPILTRKCAGCHNSNEGNIQTDTPMPNFADIEPMTYKYRLKENRGIDKSGAGAFSRSYHDLNPYVRRPGPESDNHLFNPYEYHANTSPLIQLLRKGHHGVTLSDEEWRTLYTWIDLNVPFWGTWLDFAKWWANDSHRHWIGLKDATAQIKAVQESRKRRNHWAKLFQKWDPSMDPEYDCYDFDDARRDVPSYVFEAPTAQPKSHAPITLQGWPRKVAMPEAKVVSIPGGDIRFRKIPAGSFVMGDAKGYQDEKPHRVKIEKDFWMAEIELPNKNYCAFRPSHYSGYIDTLGKDHDTPGIDAMKPNMPAIRISWQEAQAYCQWLSEKLGKVVRLPTEAEWEYAARAGTSTPYYWGNDPLAFASYENFADKALDNFPEQRQAFNYYLREMRVDDKHMVVCNTGSYQPNPFGLKDMLGNVCEWTASPYLPYPYHNERDTANMTSERVARGGAWDLLPRFSRASIRTPYHPWQRVANVGIRLVIE